MDSEMEVFGKDEAGNAAIIRSMIETENRLLNDRINWLVTIQGLLFAALGFVWDKSDARGLIAIFSLLGITVSLSAWTSLNVCNQARRELLRWWDTNKPSDYQGPDVIGIRAFGQPIERLHPWRLLPFLFISGWAFVLVFNWRRVCM
jgi:hypothetical protein